MMKNLILISIIISLYSSCLKIKPIQDLEDKIVTGQIIDQESGDVIIGLKISEYGNIENQCITNLNGEFEIEFKGTIPIIILYGFYSPILVKIKPENKNVIFFNNRLVRKSNKLYSRYIKG